MASRDPEGLCVMSHFGFGLTTLNQTPLLKLSTLKYTSKKFCFSYSYLNNFGIDPLGALKIKHTSKMSH